MKNTVLFVLSAILFTSCKASTIVDEGINDTQNNTYWQQHVDYTMNIEMNVENYQYTGTQHLVYTNNSPDTLNKVFYHLFYNAFQPGSEMDVHSLSVADPDPRVGDRISKLKPEDIGFLKVISLKQNGVDIKYETVGTILEVALQKPILPGESVTFDMEFNGQVPLQIRRAGKNNKEGVALSMAQWYPKLAEYDFEGWHADPYIAREFHGVWGDFDVKITIDKNYTIGGTGYLQNPNEIGHGYNSEKVKSQKGDKLTWHFVAPNVHDFTWAADPDYLHDKLQVPDGPELHFFYQNDPKIIENWKNLQPQAVELMQFYSANIGKYPYDQYSIIQGGDGGMEYGMCTLINGNGRLFGVTAHEMAHSWFQFILATNEAKHSWMDEGFTSYIDNMASNEVLDSNSQNPNSSSYRGYYGLVAAGIEQPQTTHSDRYNYNFAYGRSAYSKGAVFLAQLGYVIGQENLNKTLKAYYDTWKFKHPTPNDFIRVAEKVSGLELDWYLNEWTQTTNTIDYAIDSVEAENNDTKVTLKNVGSMPMPLDVVVEFTDGSKQTYNIPLRMMRGVKPTNNSVKLLEDWAWVAPQYTFRVDRPLAEVKSVVIDPRELMADINRANNVFTNKSF